MLIVNNAHNDAEEDDPPQAPGTVRMSYECNNNKHDVTPGRRLELRTSMSRREIVSTLKANGFQCGRLG